MSKVEMKTNNEILSELYGTALEIDISQNPKNRIANFLKRVKNPNLIQGKDYQIELAWSDTDRTIQDCLKDLLTLINK